MLSSPDAAGAWTHVRSSSRAGKARRIISAIIRHSSSKAKLHQKWTSASPPRQPGPSPPVSTSCGSWGGQILEGGGWGGQAVAFAVAFA
jgi:hypothetical protein